MGNPHLADSIKITFGPTSAIAKALKDGKRGRYPWKHMGDNVVLEFMDDPNTIHNPMSASLFEGLVQLRSPSFAEGVLENMSFALRHDIEIPRKHSLLLADALDRVRDEDNAVHFLYGPQPRRGRPDKDIKTKFLIYQLIESGHTAHGRLSSSRHGVGAYEVTQELLRQMGVWLEISELRRIRRQVHTKASSNIEYMLMLVSFLEGRGYKVRQV